MAGLLVLVELHGGSIDLTEPLRGQDLERWAGVASAATQAEHAVRVSIDDVELMRDQEQGEAFLLPEDRKNSSEATKALAQCDEAGRSGYRLGK